MSTLYFKYYNVAVVILIFISNNHFNNRRRHISSCNGFYRNIGNILDANKSKVWTETVVCLYVAFEWVSYVLLVLLVNLKEKKCL